MQTNNTYGETTHGEKMPQADDLKKLQERIAELEQQLDEERQEMEWDLKAVRETSAASIRKLEQELKQIKKSSTSSDTRSSAAGGADLQRALMAERKVAELQVEIKRVRESAPKISASNDDLLMRQRAESAEKERDDLRRKNRTYERTLSEKDRALHRAEEKAENTAELKRKMEEIRRELMAKDRELSKLKFRAEQAQQGEQDTDQLRKQLADALSQLDEKNANLGLSQSKVRELADEIAFLKEQNASMEKEREELKASNETLAEKVQSNQQTPARQSELENQVGRLEQELARMKMASSQMLEQREREAQRLKNDLSDIKDNKSRDKHMVSELEARKSSLERELSLVRAERDEAVSALRRFREGESTVVSRRDIANQRSDDPFDESTKRVALGEIQGADRSLDSTQPNLPSAPSDGDSQAVVPGELIVENSDSKVFPEPSDSNISKLDKDQAAGLRKGEKFASNSTHPGEPPPLEPQEEDLPKLEIIGDLDNEESLELGEPELEGAEASSDHDDGDIAKYVDHEDNESPDEQPESSDLMVEWMGEGQEAQASHSVSDETQSSSPEVASSAKSLPGAVKWALTGLVGLAGVGAIIAGALYFFPRWFGTQGVELANNTQQLDTTDSSVAESSEPADGGLLQALSGGGDSSKVDGGTTSDSGVELTKADEQKLAGSDSGIEEKQKPAHERTPRQVAALHSAWAHGFKLLKKRKYKLALRFIEPWIRREPDDPVLRYLYGRCLFYRKKLNEAREQMEKAVELKSDYPDAWYELIGMYAKLRDKVRTRDAMQRFLSLVPKNDRRAKGVAAGYRKLKSTP